MRVSKALSLPILLLSTSLPSSIAESSRTAQQAVLEANKLLAEGSYLEAARSYSEAIDLDPNSYVNYYKRATAYLSLGRHNAAIEDFDSILRLNPGFVQAHLQKAKVLAKEGDFTKAGEEIRLYRKTKQDGETDELAESISAANIAKGNAQRASKSQDWNGCVAEATKALEVGPNSQELRELRVGCASNLSDIEAVYGDLSRLATLNPSTLSLPLRLSHISYFILASPQAMTHIKQCLHYDPDSKPCKKMHKLLRNLEKDTAKARNFVEGGAWRPALKILDGDEGLLKRFDDAMDAAERAGETGEAPYIPKEWNAKRKSESRLAIYAMACKAAVGANDLRKNKGQSWCEETLAMDEDNQDALVGKAEKLLKEESWEEAVRVLEKAFESSGRQSQEIMNRLQKAQRLLKVSKQKDYYKVLGVPRDADERTIKKAFRKAAKVAHPDVGGSEEKMAALNEAYEVLSNEELRTRYDNGDDPNDHSSGHQHNPFAHHGGGMPFFFQQGGGFPGGGGGQKFHFQFGG